LFPIESVSINSPQPIACMVVVEAIGLQKHTSNNLDLGNSVRVTELNTDLRRSRTLTGELADLLNNQLGGGFEP